MTYTWFTVILLDYNTSLHSLAPNINEKKTASEKIWKFGQEAFPAYFKV
jgi:hypothetical protein